MSHYITRSLDIQDIINSNAYGCSGCREQWMIGPVESSSKVSSSTATAMAISSSDAREAVLNILKPAKSCFCTEEVSGDVDIQ